MRNEKKIIQFGKKSWSNMPFHYRVPSPSTALEIGCFWGDDVGKKSLKDKKVELNAMIWRGKLCVN